MFRKTHFFLAITLFFILFCSFNEKAYCQNYYQLPPDRSTSEPSEQSFDYNFTVIDFGYILSPTTISSGCKLKYGLKFGFGFDLYNLDNSLIFHIRFDYTYDQWKAGSNDDTMAMLMYTGLRLYVPVADFLLIYGEAGPEYRWSDIDSSTEPGIGLAFGAGIDFLITISNNDSEAPTQLILGFNFRYHYKYYDMMSLTPYIGIRY